MAKNKDLPNEPNYPVDPVNPVKKNNPTPACLDGLTNPDLPWIPAENKVYKTENQRIRNNPNKEKWNYDYAPDWYIRVLDAVHFSPKKRKTMTDRDLEKHASCIVRTFQNPEQFLLDIHAITLRQKPIEPKSASVAEASSFSITQQPPQADSTSNSPEAGRSKLEALLPIEPNSQETHANEYELCEV